LGSAFSKVPDKFQAWQDLIKLTQDEDSGVRIVAAEALGKVFSKVSDKDHAWQILLRLTRDENNDVRLGATGALGSAFSHVPDKARAWQDLMWLTQEEDIYMRRRVAEVLGAAFDLVPDREKAWQDLIRLTKDLDSNVRSYAYYSLGKASVSKANEADDSDILRSELEASLTYFEKSSQESGHSPARFCYQFYRAYFAITFQRARSDEVQRYLAEAKEAVGVSESKDVLLKAVENLAQALQESQRLKGRPFQEIVSELNAYRWYCDKAASYMTTAEESAPVAVKLMRKCNPLLDERIQATIAEIQKKARQICEITRGSGIEYEAPAAELQKAAKGLSAGDLSNIQKSSFMIALQLKKFCRLLPAEDKEQVCEIVEEIEHEPEFPEKLNKIMSALLCLGPVLVDKSTSLPDVVILTVLPEEYGCIRNRLTELGPSPDLGLSHNLYAWTLGKVFCENFKADYKVAVGMIGRAGTNQATLAVIEAVQLWRPRYILFSGIAGGLPDLKEENAYPRLGDVVVADVIYGYEYGKIDKKFKPRANWTYRTDQALLAGAIAYALSDGWREHIKATPPWECAPKVTCGEIASSDKLMDDPTSTAGLR
jgi:HEAT repeat protein/nucleoside phosphorylase